MSWMETRAQRIIETLKRVGWLLLYARHTKIRSATRPGHRGHRDHGGWRLGFLCSVPSVRSVAQSRFWCAGHIGSESSVPATPSYPCDLAFQVCHSKARYLSPQEGDARHPSLQMQKAPYLHLPRKITHIHSASSNLIRCCGYSACHLNKSDCFPSAVSAGCGADFVTISSRVGSGGVQPFAGGGSRRV